MALSTRTVNISLRFPTAQTSAQVSFFPDFAAGDGQVLVEETYTATITGGAPSTTLTGSIALPVKSTGYVAYRAKFPRDTGFNEHYIYLEAGAGAVDLSDLLNIAAVVGVDLALGDLSDVTITSAASGDYLRYNGTNWVDSTIQAGDLPTNIDATRIANGSVDNTEFQYLNGVSSNIQTQLDGKTSLAFKTIAVSGQSDVVADAKDDTLTLVAGSNITITTNATTDAITIAATDTTGITGSGTSTYVTYWDGTSTVTADSDFVWDATNNALTVGAMKVGNTSGYAALGHKDIFSVSNYAVLQLNTGETLINAKSGQVLKFRNDNSDTYGMKFDGHYWTINYDASNYMAMDVTSTGVFNFGAYSGTSAQKFTFNAAVEVPDSAYGSGWNGSVAVPTRNAVYDAIGDITAAGRALLDDADAAAQRTTLGLGTLATQNGTFSGTSSGTNTGDQNLFSTIAVSGQSNVVADATSDTLTLVAGANITITTDATTDSITIAATDTTGVTGSGTSNQLTYWTGSSTIGSLTTATYPSLTELSYVKGVTSAIQTQLDAKMTTSTYDTNADGVVDKTAQVVITVRNDEATSLTIGEVVYISGANGTHVLAKRALATTDALSAGTIGLVLDSSISAGADGKVILHGTIEGVNTNAFIEGDLLWLSDSVAGGLTATRPTAPSHGVTIGWVAKKSGGAGKIVLHIQNGYELNELHNVYINGVGSNHFLVYDATVGETRWENRSPADARTALGLGTLATQNGTFSGTSSGTNTGDQTITLTGDVTGSGTGSFAATIGNSKVTYAKIQDVSATDKILGRSTAGAGVVEEITCTSAGRALIDDADASAQRTTLGLGTLSTLNGSGTANEIAYWSTTSNISSLTTATYPSLTELSYVKGVTSAIQTQLNAKGTFTLPALTTGSVLFSNGTTIAQDNSNFFWDDTNNRLGIGTSSPQITTHIVSTGKQLRLAYDGNYWTNIGVDSSGNTVITGSTANSEQTNATLSPVGRLQLGALTEGAQSDTSKLDLTGRYGSNAAGHYGNNKIILYRSSDAVTTNYYGLGISAGLLEVQAAGDIGFFAEDGVTTKTRRVTIKGDTGRVGIGTSSPSYTLDVNGKVNASSGVVTRVTGTTSSATPTPDSDATDLYSLTALATNPTFGAPTGTPANGQKLMIRIKDNGTARTLSWNGSYVAGGVSLPTTTVAGKIMHLGFIYNTDNSLNKWMLIAKSEEA